MPIALLSEDVSSLIAAGEVVERPVSVVKELIENSLDAAAHHIEVKIEGAPGTSIEVADDGTGIPAAEIALAATRHATSKVRTAEDLGDIHTLGFRGEALASMAAVSRMELVSREGLEPIATRLVMEPGSAPVIRPAGAPPGTAVRVRDLFFNVPARRKFLRSDETERRRIQTLVARYALAYPDVRFRLILEGKTVLETTGRGDRREALGAVVGTDLARQFLPLPETESGGITVEGFVSPLSVHRSNRREITLFVNGRWIQDAGLTTAVTQAYRSLLMVGRFPMAVIHLHVPPDHVDVNVHPAKTEIRLRDPEKVFALVQRVVRATLLRQGPHDVDLDLARPRTWTETRSDPLPGGGSTWEARAAASAVGPIADPTQHVLIPPGEIPLLRLVGQVGSAYLVAEGPDGLYLIDQHAAHERVLFEGMMESVRAGGVASQALLEAAHVELAAPHASLLNSQLGTLGALGFDLESFGGTTFLVRAVPALLGGLDPAAALRSVVEDFEEDETPLGAEVEARLAARVCKRAAVKAGQVLSLAEQAELLRTLEACASPRTCPHGRPTMIHLSVETLERQFGRRG
ncbi:MAG: DNA mismatch repair endonuclease MutL [Anaerolineales bacterium]